MSIAPTREAIAGAIRLSVDGQDFGSRPRDGDGTATWSGAVALRLARALAMGSAATITPDAKPPQIQSLAGASAVLRFVDAAQDRAGTVAALVATGGGADRSTAPVVPKITAWRGPRTAPASATRARQLRARLGVRMPNGCDDKSNGPPHDSALALDGHHALVMLSCGLGAYNLPVIGYVVTDGRVASGNLAPGIRQDDTAGIVNA